MTTETQKTGEQTDEEIEARLDTLYAKKELDEDESKEFDTLKKERSSRYQKKIDQATGKVKEFETENERLKRENEELKQRQEEFEAKRKADEKPVKVVEDTVEADGKKWFTDEALQSKVDAGEMTAQEAYKHQQSRLRAEAVQEAEERFEAKQKVQRDTFARDNDRKKVLSKYPQFDKNHHDHDPNDPVFKKASEIYANGYASNPEGLSKAVELAEQILGINNKRPDASDDFGVASNDSSSDNKKKESVSLTEEEKEVALRQYVFSGATNPNTGRGYTNDEALERARKAKEKRIKSRRVT